MEGKKIKYLTLWGLGMRKFIRKGQSQTIYKGGDFGAEF